MQCHGVSNLLRRFVSLHFKGKGQDPRVVVNPISAPANSVAEGDRSYNSKRK